MAQFKGTMLGQGVLVSRLGNKKSGLSAQLSGWKMGVMIELHHDLYT